MSIKNEPTTMSLKEVTKSCFARRHPEAASMENVRWYQKVSACAADIYRTIVAGFSAQVEYPLGRIIRR